MPIIPADKQTAEDSFCLCNSEAIMNPNSIEKAGKCIATVHNVCNNGVIDEVTMLIILMY